MEDLKKSILDIIETKHINCKGGLAKLAVALSGMLRTDTDDVILALKTLEDEGDIFEYSKHKYASSKLLGLVKGKVSYSNNNYSFVTNPDGDVFVLNKNLMGSFDGDYVLVKILSKEFSNRKREGKVVKILKRSDDYIVGTFSRIKSYGYVRPDKKKFDRDIFVDVSNINGARDGDKVVVTILGYKSGNPVGKVIEVIGDVNAVGNDIKCILRSYKIVEDFDDEVLRLAKAIPQQIDKESCKNRRDLTDLMLFTIDGEDAKDLDDAVSLEMTSDGCYNLGVHIADVGEYVKKDSKIDESAYERGTSVYFLNSVIPMLPRELSNGICSLNPNVERLALSVMMKIDKKGNILSSDIFESVIRSKYRLNYNEVLKVIEGDPDTQSRLSEIKDTLMLMYELSGILDEKRKTLGSLDFDLPEGKIIVDKNNKPLEVIKTQATKSTKIIETFMVVANEVVAKTFSEKKIPFVYRVHEKPDPDKMANFFDFVSMFGVNVKADKKFVEPKDLQQILSSVENLPAKEVVNMVMLRSLKKAKYFDTCLGHFGLALNYYCHFTSPIRRYPDLTIHRIIKEYLHGNMSYIKSPKMVDFVSKASIKSSECEKNAEDAERAVEDYKKCEYMSGFVGQNFEGIISGLNQRGFFVELDNTCEGFVPVATLKDDFYDYDERKYMLCGKTHFFKIGERVEVKLQSCELQERKINFEFVKKVK